MCGGSGDVEEDLIWLRVRRGWSQWKGLVGDGVLKPEKKCNNYKMMPLLFHQQVLWYLRGKDFCASW